MQGIRQLPSSVKPDRRLPEVLGGQLASQQHRRVLAHRLLDDPAALGDAGDDLEGPAAQLLRLLLALAVVQEPATQLARW